MLGAVHTFDDSERCAASPFHLFILDRALAPNRCHSLNDSCLFSYQAPFMAKLLLQAVHAPPPLLPLAIAASSTPPPPVCEHCGREIRPSPVVSTEVDEMRSTVATLAAGDNNGCSSSEGAKGAADHLRFGVSTSGSTAASRSVFTSSSLLRGFLQGVVGGRRSLIHGTDEHVRRPRPLLFLSGCGGSVAASGQKLDSGSGSDVEVLMAGARGGECGNVGPLSTAAAPAGKAKKKSASKAKKKRASLLSRSLPSRVDALLKAFEEASPSAASSVTLDVESGSRSTLKAGTEMVPGMTSQEG